MGTSKLVWFNALKASARNWALNRSVRRKFLEGENDVSEVGPLFGVATEGAGLADGGNDLGGGGARGKGKPLAAIGGTVDGSREVINAVVQGSESVVGVSQEGKLGAAAGEEEAG